MLEGGKLLAWKGGLYARGDRATGGSARFRYSTFIRPLSICDRSCKGEASFHARFTWRSPRVSKLRFRSPGLPKYRGRSEGPVRAFGPLVA